MSVLKFILIALEVLLLFNLLIFVHELGHFLAARWRGLKVDRFAIWFGKPIWKARINGVEYALGTIPAGGYVSLPQMATMEAIEGKGESSGQQLPPISALDKIIVAFAGPLFSLLLAFAFAVVVWGVGHPVNNDDNTTTVGWVDVDGPAWKAGLRPGDRIVSVDDHPVTQFLPPAQDSVTWRIITSTGTNIAIKYTREGNEHTAYATPFRRPTHWYERKALRQLLILPQQSAIVYDVVSNSPAALAGLQRGDQVVKLNGEKVFSPMAVMNLEDEMTNHAVTPVTFSVVRGVSILTVRFSPKSPCVPARADLLLGFAHGRRTPMSPWFIQVLSSSLMTAPARFLQRWARCSRTSLILVSSNWVARS